MDNDVVFIDNSEKILQAFRTATGVALNLIGSQATGHLQDNTPVRTGNLVNHADWDVDTGEQFVEVGFKTDPDPDRDPYYAIYVEEGSTTNRAQHMLRKAVTGHNDEYRAIAERVYRNS